MVAGERMLLFISHHSGDAAAAQRVEEALRTRGVACWMAPRDVEPGEPFDEAIDSAIGRCAAVLLLVSAPAAESRHVKRELIIADNRRKMIIPLRLEPVEPQKLSYHLADSQWIDWDNGSDAVVDRIAARVRGAADAPAAAAAAPSANAPMQAAVPAAVKARRSLPAAAWAGLGALAAAVALVLAYVLLDGRRAAPDAGTAQSAPPAGDAQLVLTPDRSSVSEGDQMKFIVARPTGASPQTLYFSLLDDGGRPMRRGNILIPGGGEPQDVPLEFRAGEEIQQVPLEIVGDAVPDDAERFTAVLRAAPGGPVLKRSTIVTIWDRGAG